MSKRLANLLAAARPTYCAFIINKLPVLVVHVGRIVGEIAHTVLYLLRCISEDKAQALEGLCQLSCLQTATIGVVLAQVYSRGLKRGGPLSLFVGYWG